MAQSKAEDTGGLMPAKDGNAALHYFDHRTLPAFRCAGYNTKHLGFYQLIKTQVF